ncbi:hypothetical protein AB0O51_27725 [Streptomyces sp. NPDC090301]|uniref:hypothetical protein n=1 Tax=Streptomyces sp. NPDC090301 TaxID=3154975 RepID=UPI003441B9D5
MLVGSAGIFLNHPVIRVGSFAMPDHVVALQGSNRLVGERHLHLAARAQMGLVRVRLWSESSPVEGSVIFDGSLRLDDGVVCVSDVTGVSSFRYGFGVPGSRRMLVSVDDPGNASRIDVVLDPGMREVALTACRNRPLPHFRVSDSSSLDPTDELGLILSVHDIPISRLSAALKLVFLQAGKDIDARSSVMMEFRVRMIGEWLRWISPTLSEAEVSSIILFAFQKIQTGSPDDVDSFSIGIASEVMRRATA